MPFANPTERALHFARHGADLGAADEYDYERIADAFMFNVLSGDVKECIRPNALDRLRYRETKRHFGVAVVASNIIRTMYVVKRFKLLRHGGGGGFFAFECGRVNL